MRPNHIILLLILIIPSLLNAQEDRYASEIEAFEVADRQYGYQEDFILFTGSSSIRLWHSIETDMKGFNILNRGFGGSTLKELNNYWSRISGDHQPEVVVVYCGENDIADGTSVSETVTEFEKFLLQYAETYPATPMIYIAMKPSIARWHLWEQYQEADVLIKELISKNEQVTFLDLSPSMLKKDGKLKEEIFIEDGLHMNKKGYKGWRKQLRSVLKAQLKAVDNN